MLLSGATMALDSVVRGGWATLRPYLAQRFHVVQFDQRGHGRTGNPGGADAYTIASLAADAAAFIKQLGLAPAHVAGWSEGGIVGLGLALDHPSVLRSLIGIGTNYTNHARTVAELRPSAQELSEVYTPTAEELVFIRESARGPSPTLTVAVLLKTVQRLAYLLRLLRPTATRAKNRLVGRTSRS